MGTQARDINLVPGCYRTTDIHMNLKLQHGLVQGTTDTKVSSRATWMVEIFREGLIQKMNILHLGHHVILLLGSLQGQSWNASPSLVHTTLFSLLANYMFPHPP